MAFRGRDRTREASTERLTSQPAPRRSGLGRFGLAGMIGALLLVALALIGLVATLLAVRDGLTNPFAERTVDRSQPAVLQAVEDLSVYKAATGHFQVVVDVEKDAPMLPAIIKGERTLFIAVGNVDAEVDFSTLAKDAVEVSGDGDAVTVTLPRPTLSEATVDPERSKVASRERGLLDRLTGVFEDNPTSERELYVVAEDKLQAAARESDLVARAEANTRATLEGMLKSLGFTRVEVRFEDPKH